MNAEMSGDDRGSDRGLATRYASCSVLAAGWLVTLLLGLPAVGFVMIFQAWEQPPFMVAVLSVAVASALALPGPLAVAVATRRRWLRVGSLAGSLLLVSSWLGWVAGAQFDPSREEIRAAADGLLPFGVEVTERGENTGHPLVAGRYFAFERFRTVRGDATSAIKQQIARAGYQITQQEVAPGGTIFYVERGPIRGDVHLHHGGTGSVTAEADPHDQMAHRWIGSGVGVVAVVAVAGAWVAMRRRPRAARPPSPATVP